MILYKKLKDVSKDEWDESQARYCYEYWDDCKHECNCSLCLLHEWFNCQSDNRFPYEKMKGLMSKELGAKKIAVPTDRVLGRQSKEWLKAIIEPFRDMEGITIRFIPTKNTFLFYVADKKRYPIAVSIEFHGERGYNPIGFFLYPREGVTEKDFELKFNKVYKPKDLGI